MRYFSVMESLVSGSGVEILGEWMREELERSSSWEREGSRVYGTSYLKLTFEEVFL